MTKQVEVQTITIGAKVYNPNFANYTRTGEIYEKDGELRVKFQVENANKELKEMSAKFDASKWLELSEGVKVSTKPKKQAETGLNAPESGNGGKSKKPETAKEEIKPLSDDEKASLTSYKKRYFALDEKEKNIHFEKAKILNAIRIGKLYREEFKTFAEFALQTFGLTREYAQKLASIGAYSETVADFLEDKKTNVSIGAADIMVRNKNVLAQILEVTETDDEKADFAPVLREVMQITQSVAKDAKGNSTITPGIVQAVNSEVQEMAKTVKPQKDETVLQAAARILGQNQTSLIEKVQARLNEKPNGKTASKTANNPANNPLPVYSGPLSNLEIKCTLHSEFQGNKILSIGNGTLQTKCLCRFKMVGFDLFPYEIEGKKVKQES